MSTRDYRDLVAWQIALELVVRCCEITRNLPEDEKFGLNAQIRRAAVSVPSNIAEGQGRSSPKEFRRYLSVAIGSLFELRTHLYIAERLGFFERKEAEDLFEKIIRTCRLVNGLGKGAAAHRGPAFKE